MGHAHCAHCGQFYSNSFFKYFFFFCYSIHLKVQFLQTHSTAKQAADLQQHFIGSHAPRHIIQFVIQFHLSVAKNYWKKRERCGKNMNRGESTMSCDCINFTAIYTVEKPYYSTGIESTYLHIRYATRPPNTTNTMNANVP